MQNVYLMPLHKKKKKIFLAPFGVFFFWALGRERKSVLNLVVHLSAAKWVQAVLHVDQGAPFDP